MLTIAQMTMCDANVAACGDETAESCPLTLQFPSDPHIMETELANNP